jgi:pyrroloquinoline quinone biosynthesis protein D
MSERTVIDEASLPAFPRGVRLKHDEARAQWVILAPERMFVLDDIGLAIMQRVDGERAVSAIVDDLADAFQAPREQILGDVIGMLQGFADKGVLSA